MNDLKILVGCHRPCMCPKIVEDNPDVFIPIIAGSFESELKPFWPKIGMINDNMFDNISWTNPNYSEYTCLYWAKKNYDLIGNPEYIGFAQYHRYLDDIQNIRSELSHDIIHACVFDIATTVYDNLLAGEENKDKLDMCCFLLEKIFSKEELKIMLNQNMFPGGSLFIVHREIFMCLMNFIEFFMVEFTLHNEYNDHKFVNDSSEHRQCRYFAFVLERLTGLFFMNLTFFHGFKFRNHLLSTYKNTDNIEIN